MKPALAFIGIALVCLWLFSRLARGGAAGELDFDRADAVSETAWRPDDSTPHGRDNATDQRAERRGGFNTHFERNR